MGRRNRQDDTGASAFGDEVRAVRIARGMTQAHLATATGVSRGYVSRVEVGTLLPSEGFARRCDRAFGTPGVFERMRVRAEREPARLYPMLGLEPQARRMCVYGPSAVPGILQTRDYAKELLRARGDIAEREACRVADTRARRREVLRGSDPMRLWAVVHESALRTLVGSRTTMLGQLEALVTWAEGGGLVTIQVYPTDGPTPASFEHFVILHLPDGSRVVWCDTLVSGSATEHGPDLELAVDVFDRLRVGALRPAESVSRLRKIASEYRT